MSQTPILHALSAALGVPDTTPDAELLRRFAEADDRTAFELVVRRHAELVWGVCRAALPRDLHAAEDAFQATFLALARRAGRVRDATAAGWLFRVARNVAVRVRARAAQRKAEPLPDALAADAPQADEEAARHEVAPVVAEEVDRLATKFRVPVLLCFFEGHTHAEAAARLGWPIGTLASRLARAKDVLRARLTRRGVVLPAAGLATVFATQPLTASGVSAALAVATGPVDRVPPAVLSLTHGVLFAMRFAKLKTVAAVAVLAVGLTAALAAVARDGSAPSRTDRAPVGGAGAALDAPKQKPDPKELEAKELKALGGEWRIVNLENDQEKIGEDELVMLRAVFTGNELRLSGVKDKEENFKIALAPGEKPKHIDLTIVADVDDPEAGKVVHGIYELSADALKLCFPHSAFDAKDRPTEFRARKGLVFCVLERPKDEKEELKAVAGEWKCVKLNVAGEDAPADEVAKVQWVIDGADVVTGAGKEEKATIKLDPAASPPTITLTFRDAGREAELLGIYFRQGDKLTLCFADPKVKDAPRPTELKPAKDRAFVVLERAAKK
jgi:RNA polymerase sigma factor (sigma-70 family)